MDTLALAIALVTYAGVAVGGVPGLALDRTGIALLAAIAMVAGGVLSTSQAIDAIDMPTILLLYALMVFSSQFRLSGFYTWAAFRITGFLDRPGLFLLALMLTSAGLSAVLMNDIVCLALTPVLAVSLLNAGLNPVPFLIGLAVSSNIGSAATIIGNPQNMLIGQLGGLDFGRFFLWCAAPSIASLAVSYIIIRLIYRKSLSKREEARYLKEHPWPDFNRRQSAKGIMAAAALVVLFFTPIPREISALAIAGLLLCSRSMHTRSLLSHVDWHLITLFCGLFIVIRGIETTGLPSLAMKAMEANGFDVRNLFNLSMVSVFLSNIVSNVPAVMLLTRFLEPAAHSQWYMLALTSTFAGNLITIGSIANLITIEQARQFGITISFKEHAKTGIPVTIVSVLIALLWTKALHLLN
jgi:Na+/H+ antiporter NhaD/arsenite permease-like protein